MTALRRLSDPIELSRPSTHEALLKSAYRSHGYLHAAINPLTADTPAAPNEATHPELVRHLHATYCGSITLHVNHLRDPGQQDWLYEQFESAAQDLDGAQASARHLSIHSALYAAERFEHTFARKHPGQKRFSLEGLESYVPFLRFLFSAAARHGVEQVVFGMPHRGRLNVLRHVLGLTEQDIGDLLSDASPNPTVTDDIKDHLGVTRRLSTPAGPLNVQLASNPSHLESITPIIAGMARACQDRSPAPSGRQRVLPLVAHGDAAFCGQGIVTETLNLALTRGYGSGGTVHVILNNQIGSTISHPQDARSTRYSADIARGYELPILHVNADDPDAVVKAAEVAVAFRQRFHRDILVDLIGYRRHGHNGQDDPTVTQPSMQRTIRARPTVVELYRDTLQNQHGLDTARIEAIEQQVDSNEPWAPVLETSPTPVSVASRNRPTPRALHVERLQALVHAMCRWPEGFVPHPQVTTMVEQWRQTLASADRPVDWRLGEALAFATLLCEGSHIRLTGLDIGRGSFFHRYCVWHHQSAGTDGEHTHIPLRHLQASQGAFAVFDTPLTEEAVVGFEHGYASAARDTLVLWEAQFGDFVNNAQVIIDQYIASGEAKWGCTSNLVMLLPHGNEGGGAEHSSAYVGRFLALCAEDNMVVAMPSTSAQMFHLLRRQAHRQDPKPLIVFTPKVQLYAQPASHSRWDDFAGGTFHNALPAPSVPLDPAQVERVVLCSGKVSHDIEAELQSRPDARIAVVRVEQLYPFPTDEVRALLEPCTRLREVAWVQEEARNHGAWQAVREWIEDATPAGVRVTGLARPEAASCATASRSRHEQQTRQLLEAVTTL